MGIFAANLTNYLLESGVDMSYNSCFRRDVKSWHDVGLKMVKTRPILMISVGYAERYRKEDLIDWKMEKDDIKPNSDDIIKWI